MGKHGGNHGRGPSQRKSSRRVAGRVKKKSVKSRAILGSTRRLATFGKEQKKGYRGISSHYMSRTRAVNNLQITLKDFRRLCILKGIYPRDPDGLKKPNGKHQTFYHVKDISFLAHEPLLKKFRDFKSFAKKFARLAGKKMESEAERLWENRPQYTLEHLVKERYPHFNDALHDMDDALSTLYLYASLPSKRLISTDDTALCTRLVREWEKYIVLSGALQRVFVSVKGIYYQAVVHGERVTWLVPHKFNQYMPKDVDFRLISTFLEFYTVAAKFVMFKLYHELGLVYPPKLDQQLIDEGAHLVAVEPERIEDAKRREAREAATVKEAESEIQKASRARIATLPAHLLAPKGGGDEDEDEAGGDEDEGEEDISPEFKETKELKMIKSAESKREEHAKLFSNLHFFASREVPRESLELCVTSFGGVLGWEGEGSPYGADDRRITHYIFDRPNVQRKYTDREYLQPQWVYDSINAQLCLPVARYECGAALPPHLSPFVNDREEGYIPEYREELDKLKSAAQDIEEAKRLEEDHEEDSEDERQEELAYAEGLKAEESGISYAKYRKTAKKKGAEKTAGQGKDDEGEDSSEEDSNSSEDSDSESDDDEGGVGSKRKVSKEAIDRAARKRKKVEAQKELEKQRAIAVMPKKAKRLYGRMQYGIAKKKEKIDKLHKKRNDAKSKSK
jgi:pescadillo protein